MLQVFEGLKMEKRKVSTYRVSIRKIGRKIFNFYRCHFFQAPFNMTKAYFLVLITGG